MKKPHQKGYFVDFISNLKSRMVRPNQVDADDITEEHQEVSSLQGFLDGILPTGEIFGWAYDKADPLHRITVYLTVDDVFLGKTKAELKREDLSAAQITDGGCAFVFSKIPIAALKQIKANSCIHAFFDPERRKQLSCSPLQLTETTAQQLYWHGLDPACDDLTLSEQKAALQELLKCLQNTGNATEAEQAYTRILVFCRMLLQLGDYQPFQQYLALDLIQSRCNYGLPNFELALLHAISSQANNTLSLSELQLLETSLFTELRNEHRRGRLFYTDYLCEVITWSYRDSHVTFFNNAASMTALSYRFLYLMGIALSSLYQDYPLAANVLNLIRRNGIFSNNALFLERCSMINRLLGNNFEAMQDIAAAIQANSQSAAVYQEAAALQLLLCEGQAHLFRQLLPRILTLIFTSFQYNPHRGGGLVQLADSLLRQYFQNCIGHTAAMALKGDINTALAERREDLQTLISALDSLHTLAGHGYYQGLATANPKPLRNFRHIFFIGSKDLWQCYQYRVKQKMEQADALGFETMYKDINSLDDEAWKRDMVFADVVYICRVPAVYTILKLISYAHQLHIPVIYDIDDYLFNERYFPAPFESYAGTIDQALHTHLTMDNPFFEQALQQADYITCSTPPLADRITEVVGADKPVVVHPNLLSPSLYQAARQTKKGGVPKKTIEIFYGSATKAHKQVIYEVFGPALRKVLERFPSVIFTAFGYFQLPPELMPFANRIEFREPTSNRDFYLQQLSEADINIAALEQDPFTDCKSEIKWMEAAAYGIPSIVTPTATYRAVVQAERDVLFAANTEEWEKQLTRLVESAALRQSIGENARRYAITHYNPSVGTNILARTLAAVSLPLMTSAQISPRKPHLLYVNVWFAPQAVGGATRVFESHVRLLLEDYAKDYELHVLTTHLNPENYAPYSVEQFFYGSALVTRVNVPLRDWSETKDETMYEFCLAFYRKYQFDLIHFHALPVITAAVVDAARTLKIPYLITLHDGWWLSKYMFLVDEEHKLVDTHKVFSGKDYSARQQQLYKCLNDASAVLAVSKKFRDIYVQAGISQTLANENGLALFNVLPRTPSPRVRVAHIGGVSYHKGFHLFREAVLQADLKHIEVHIIDHSLESGEAYQSQWGGTPVIFLPKYKQAEINSLYANIDVLAAPSIWPEAYGLVTREAAYAGVWVIASDRGAVGDCVDDGVNGRIVSVDDASALRQALLEIDANPAKFLIPCAQKIVRTVAEQMQECVLLYQTILADHVGAEGQQKVPLGVNRKTVVG